MRKDVIIEIVFYAMERANEKMGVICISTLIMQEMQNMCIAGSWSRPIQFRKIQKTIQGQTYNQRSLNI